MKHIFKALITVITIILAITLFFILQLSHKNTSNFERTFNHNLLKGTDTLNLDLNSFYIAGLDTNIIYLGNHTNPTSFLSINTTTNKPILTSLDLSAQRIDPYGLKLSMFNKKLFLFDMQKPSVFTAALSNIKNLKEHILSAYLDQHTLISATSLVGVGFNKVLKQTELIKLNFNYKEAKNHSYQLIPQADGYLCSRGSLVYNGNLLIYTYSFRNQFICLDTNLNEVYKGKTIDSNAHINFSVVKLNSDSSRNFSNPPLYVNKIAAANKDYLFINSGVIAKNETSAAFKNTAVIDVYALSNGKYRFSFYIPNYKGKKIRSFKVAGYQLIALSGNHLLSYNLKF